MRVPVASVRRFVEDVLTALGASSEECGVITDGLVTACLWGHPGQGQGLEKLFRYARRARNGGIVPRATMRWVVERPAAALLDAGKGFGYVAAHRAMVRAVAMARDTGLAVVGVRHSNHFGIAGYHARTAAVEGFIGVAMTNAGAEMAPWGSATPVVGTNPWGIAVPRPAPWHPLILDMALTQSGKGMIRWMERSGLPIPPHWALTGDGKPTTDPGAARDGPLLPIGDHKGAGLSLVTDVLTGVMTGAKFGTSVFRDDLDYDVGHTLMAIDPTVYLDRPTFDDRLERLIAEYHSAAPLAPDRPVMLPGQIEHERAAGRRRTGVPVARETWEQLRDLATDLRVAWRLHPKPDTDE